MARYFECLHCGNVTPLEETPPKCARCGHGTGVIHEGEPGGANQAPGEDRTKPGSGGPREPGGKRVA